MDQSPNRLKAESNTANGGIGVSYSNVVLAGGKNPLLDMGGHHIRHPPQVTNPNRSNPITGNLNV